MSKKIKVLFIALLALGLMLQPFSGSLAVKAASYTPGTYSATEDGYLGEVTVTITVDETTITDVQIEAPDETPAIGGAAAEDLAAAMLEKNTVDVDAVSGATFTSDGVLAAAKEAIAQAGGSSASAGGNTYSATDDGFGGEVTVTITVDDAGNIVDATVEGPDETPAYGGAALPELAEQIKAANGGEIDGVSGATFTSDGVKAAYKAALESMKGDAAASEAAPATGTEEAAETVTEAAPEENKVTFKSLIIIFISAILINNVVLSQFLGICPFLGVSKKVETAAGMGAAVIFVITIASMCTFGIQKLVLDKLGLEYMQTIVFILVIAALVQFVEMVLKKLMPGLYKALGVYLPLITTNCAVLGVSINNITYGHTFLESIFYSVGISTGFALAIVIMAGIRERNEDNDVPNAFKGSPIVLITACLMAIAFTGFAGLL